MSKKLEIDYIELAISSIEIWFECPVCVFREQDKEKVANHIITQHTIEQIKEICTP